MYSRHEGDYAVVRSRNSNVGRWDGGWDETRDTFCANVYYMYVHMCGCEYGCEQFVKLTKRNAKKMKNATVVCRVGNRDTYYRAEN